jgi:hypothetical protein
MVGETHRFITCDIVRRSSLGETTHIEAGPTTRLKFEEFIMKIASSAIAVALFAATAASLPASAATSLYATEPSATAACAADEVVWVDLDRGKFYHKASASFAKGNNGGYACLRAAHAQYREGHE